MVVLMRVDEFRNDLGFNLIGNPVVARFAASSQRPRYCGLFNYIDPEDRARQLLPLPRSMND